MCSVEFDVMQDVVISKHHGGRKDVRDVAQQKDETIVPDGTEDKVMCGIVDENPEGMVDDGADGIAEDGGEPYGEVGGSGDGKKSLKDD